MPTRILFSIFLLTVFGLLNACDSFAGAPTTPIDSGVVEYEFSPARDKVFYLKDENGNLALWECVVASNTKQKLVDVTERARLRDIRGPRFAVLENGDIVIKSGVNLFRYANGALTFYPLENIFRYFGSENIRNLELNAEQRAEWADHYRALRASNDKIFYLDGFSEYPQDRFYFLNGQDGAPLYLQEAFVLGNVNGKTERIFFLDKNFNETEPAKFGAWQLFKNPNAEVIDRGAEIKDVTSGITLTQVSSGDCQPAVTGNILPCNYKAVVRARDKTYRFGENEFLYPPYSNYFTAADGTVILHVLDKLVRAE